MTDTVVHPGHTIRPLLIVIAGFVVALAVALVLVISAWASDGESGTGSTPTPVTVWPCDRTGPC